MTAHAIGSCSDSSRPHLPTPSMLSILHNMCYHLPWCAGLCAFCWSRAVASFVLRRASHFFSAAKQSKSSPVR
jgi:hypothetical protein